MLVHCAGKLLAHHRVGFGSFDGHYGGLDWTFPLLGFLFLHINLLLNLLTGLFKPFDAGAAKYLASLSRFRAVNLEMKKTSKRFY